MSATFRPGDRVTIIPTEGSAILSAKWFPTSGRATGVVERTFKNGKVAVAVDQVRNFSDDGRWTGHFLASEVHQIDATGS